MTKYHFSLKDLENEEFVDSLSEEETFLSTRVIRSESLNVRDKEKNYGNKSKSRFQRREVSNG